MLRAASDAAARRLLMSICAVDEGNAMVDRSGRDLHRPWPARALLPSDHYAAERYADSSRSSTFDLLV